MKIKLSEFKKQIREEIISTLAEEEKPKREFKIKIINKNGPSTTQTVHVNPESTELFDIISNIKKSKNVLDVKVLDKVKEDSSALVTSKSGTKSVSYKNPSELDQLKRDPNVSTIATTAGQKIKEDEIKEGTWAKFDNGAKIKAAITQLELWKKQYYNVVGDDEVFDGIDNAIQRIQDIQDGLRTGRLVNEGEDSDSEMLRKILYKFDDSGLGDVIGSFDQADFQQAYEELKNEDTKTLVEKLPDVVEFNQALNHLYEHFDEQDWNNSENLDEMKISSDEPLNPQLKKDIQGVRGGMVGAAEKQPLPPRFKSEPDKDKPRFHITDTKTGKKTVISLYAYGDVRQALNDLFSEGKTNENKDLNEMARIATVIKIRDKAKAEEAKKQYAGKWIEAMIKAVEDAGEDGITQPALADALGKGSQQVINPKVRELLSSGAFVTGTGSGIPKEKPKVSTEPKSTTIKSKKTVSFDDGEKEPPAAAIAKVDKKIGTSHAAKLTPEQEDKYERIKKGILAKVSKLTKMGKAEMLKSEDMKMLKALINKDEVKALFKSKGVNVKDLVKDIIA